MMVACEAWDHARVNEDGVEGYQQVGSLQLGAGLAKLRSPAGRPCTVVGRRWRERGSVDADSRWKARDG